MNGTFELTVSSLPRAQLFLFLETPPPVRAGVSNKRRTMRIPRLSVIIPTYNRSTLLVEAIRSVLAQSFTNFELIVIDDGSVDSTSQVVAAIKDERLRYLWLPHRGISAALNNGLLHARGGYIARLDSDDLWLPNMLATLVSFLDSHPEIGVAYGKGQAIDHQGRILTHTQGLPERFPNDSLRSLLYEDCTCNIALVARRECFEKAGPYDETMLAHEDWDMWIRVARHYPFFFVDQLLAYIRWHDGNFTGINSPHFETILTTRAAPLDKLFNDPELPQTVRTMKSQAYTNVFLYSGQRWMQRRAWRRAANDFIQAVKTSDRPLVTATRVAWLSIATPLLKRTEAGRRAITAIAGFRRRLRERPEQLVVRRQNN